MPHPPNFRHKISVFDEHRKNRSFPGRLPLNRINPKTIPGAFREVFEFPKSAVIAIYLVSEVSGGKPRIEILLYVPVAEAGLLRLKWTDLGQNVNPGQ